MSSIYTGASGIIANMQRLDLISNNISNIDTSGYKSDQATFKVFNENLALRNDQNGKTGIGHYSDEVYADNVTRSFDPGDSKVTGQNLDFLLHDTDSNAQTSFFIVEKGGEKYLTRNGSFTLDAERRLSTQNGALVLDTNGNPITIPEGTQFSTNQNGEIQDPAGKVIGKIQMTTVDHQDLGLLEKKYGSFFQPMTVQELQNNFGPLNQVLQNYDSNVTLQSRFGSKQRVQDIINSGQVRIFNAPNNVNLESGMVESSNVNMSQEMTALIDAQRQVQANQKSETTMDTILNHEANDLGK